MLKIGTKVRIRKDSEYYIDNQPNNPKDINGKIIINNCDTSHNYKVEWSNSKTNYYREKDLEEINPFILPEKWYIDGNLDRKLIGKWFDENRITKVNTLLITGGERYLHWPVLVGNSHSKSYPHSDYTEITFDQFKKYVLKEDITINKLDDKSLKLEEIQSKLIKAKYDKEDIKDILECLNK